MRKSNGEFEAEIFRRFDEYKEKKKKRHRAVRAASLCMAVVLLGAAVLLAVRGARHKAPNVADVRPGSSGAASENTQPEVPGGVPTDTVTPETASESERGTEPSAPDPMVYMVKETDEIFSAAYTEFALGLLRAGLEDGKNTLVSPLSVMEALAMMANGACGETLGEMERVIGGGIPVSELARYLAGFAAGVMVAASIWSLLIPAIEQSEDMGKLSFLPAFIGFWVGVLFLLLLDRLIPHLHVGSEQAEGPKSKLGRTTMMVLAVTLHNIPEGMAVGVVYAGFLSGNTQITAASALALSLGIAIQNFPEGAIISMPLRAEGERKGRAFLGGVLSGVVEPIGAVLTLLAAQLVIPALPYLLSFAAGAMLYVVVEELIPEMSQGKHSNIGTIFFAVGFSVMMTLDVALG